MKIPIIRGLIERRILVNYRVDPHTLAAQLPAPFRPQLVQGHVLGGRGLSAAKPPDTTLQQSGSRSYALVGICLIRLAQVRPRGLPRWLGFGSENAAHRAAVEWEDEGTTRHGVYIRRRDSTSRLNALLGGRIFPGIHHHAQFTVDEGDEHWNVAMQSDDGVTSLAVRTHRADALPAGSIFGSLEAASAFYAAGALGYSDTYSAGRYQGLELNCRRWTVEALAVDDVRSSYFDDPAIFPRGTIEFDNALLMRGIEHEWHGHADLCCESA